MVERHEFEAILSKGETVAVEFKESISALAGIASTVCAFANDINALGGGSIYVGVDKNGHVVGTSDADDALQKIVQLRVDGSITPTPSMTIESFDAGGMTVICLKVSPSDSPPVRRSGVAYVRIGTTTTKATPEEERRLSENRRGRAVPFDARGLAGTSKSDLDIKRLQLDYLPQAIDPAVLQENGRPLDAQLAALKLADNDGQITPTGLMVAGVDPLTWIPGSYVQFRRVAGTDITNDTLDEFRITGTIDLVCRLLEEKMLAHNVTSMTISESRHQKANLYPITALNQITRNALMHRDYEMSSPVRVTWFDDRIQVDNPGGPFQISAENFGEPGYTSYRNPNIAEAMHNLGLVERFGVGIPLARRALDENGNPPLELRTEGNFVFAVLRAQRQ